MWSSSVPMKWLCENWQDENAQDYFLVVNTSFKFGYTKTSTKTSTNSWDAIQLPWLHTKLECTYSINNYQAVAPLYLPHHVYFLNRDCTSWWMMTTLYLMSQNWEAMFINPHQFTQNLILVSFVSLEKWEKVWYVLSAWWCVWIFHSLL